MYNSVMVLNFVDNYIRNDYDIPDSMLETNIRIDDNIIRKLIRYDRKFSHNSGIIEDMLVKGFVLGDLKDIFPFPSNYTNDLDSILSMLFYFGMITIDGSYQVYNRFVISNKATRQQIYKLLREENVQIG